MQTIKLFLFIIGICVSQNWLYAECSAPPVGSCCEIQGGLGWDSGTCYIDAICSMPRPIFCADDMTCYGGECGDGTGWRCGGAECFTGGSCDVQCLPTVPDIPKFLKYPLIGVVLFLVIYFVKRRREKYS